MRVEEELKHLGFAPETFSADLILDLDDRNVVTDRISNVCRQQASGDGEIDDQFFGIFWFDLKRV